MTDVVSARPDAARSTGDFSGPVFDFHITPNISLGRSGVIIVLSAVAVPAAAIALAFTISGYWPVGIFSSLAYGGLVLGFRCARRSMRRLERIFLSDGDVVIERMTPTRRHDHVRVPAFGLHLVRFIDPDFGHLSLVLRHRDRKIEIARDLSPAERERFEGAFVTAMRAAGHAIQATTVRALSQKDPEAPR